MSVNLSTMKNLSIAALSLLLIIPLFGPTMASAASEDNQAIQTRINAMLAAVANGTPKVWLQADNYNTNLELVMKWNGDTREQAIARMARALISVSGNVPKPAIPQGYGAAYDPAPHAYRQAASRNFYAGMNVVTNQPVFLPEQRTQMGDNFWYCPEGQMYVYETKASKCQ